MAKIVNPFSSISKKLEALKAKSEKLTQEITDLSALVARRHILSDLQQERWKMGDHVPQDEADYVSMGLF